MALRWPTWLGSGQVWNLEKKQKPTSSLLTQFLKSWNQRFFIFNVKENQNWWFFKNSKNRPTLVRTHVLIKNWVVQIKLQMSLISPTNTIWDLRLIVTLCAVNAYRSLVNYWWRLCWRLWERTGCLPIWGFCFPFVFGVPGRLRGKGCAAYDCLCAWWPCPFVPFLD